MTGVFRGGAMRIRRAGAFVMSAVLATGGVWASPAEAGGSGNDQGGLGDDPLVSGFDPTRKGFYNGGDLAGLRRRIDYIRGLGTTSIWLTPSFKNKPVQLEDGPSAGYHGYWITDFTQIDPHPGTNE